MKKSEKLCVLFTGSASSVLLILTLVSILVLGLTGCGQRMSRPEFVPMPPPLVACRFGQGETVPELPDCTALTWQQCEEAEASWVLGLLERIERLNLRGAGVDRCLEALRVEGVVR